MPRIVACIKTYEVIEDRAVKISNHLSDELIEAVFYSFIKHREQALKELPAEEGAPIEGPQSIKEMITHIKAELQDIAHKVGASLVAGMAESLAKNMPLYRMARVTDEGPKRGIADSFYSIIPSKMTVLDLLMGQQNTATRLSQAGLEIIDEDVSRTQVTQEIKAIEEELSKINTESHFAQDIKLFQRCLWQSLTLRKRIWLYVFHMTNFFWNSIEAEKSRSTEGIVKMILWGAGAVFSFIELRKSASYKNIFSLNFYTPERCGLTVLKTSFVALFILQYFAFTSFENLTYVSRLDKTLEKIFISIIGSTVLALLSLTLLKNGYEIRIEKRRTELAEHKSRLHELLAQRVALIKEN